MELLLDRVLNEEGWFLGCEHFAKVRELHFPFIFFTVPLEKQLNFSDGNNAGEAPAESSFYFLQRKESFLVLVEHFEGRDKVEVGVLDEFHSLLVQSLLSLNDNFQDVQELLQAKLQVLAVVIRLHLVDVLKNILFVHEVVLALVLN